MRLITILIAGRCNHVLDFDAALRADDAPETYVLSQEGVSTQLFEFYNALDVDCKNVDSKPELTASLYIETSGVTPTPEPKRLYY